LFYVLGFGMAVTAIIGAGSWGTALASVLANSGHSVRLWAYEAEVARAICECHENKLFLPNVMLPHSIAATTDLAAAVSGAKFVITSMPSHVCRGIYGALLPFLEKDMILVSATKGIETGSLLRISEVIHDVIGDRFVPKLVVMSGPSFAREVAHGDPTAIVVASSYRALAQTVQEQFSSRTLRLYASDDIVGVELGGAVKNVIAIAAGVIEGLELGHNSLAALITRGLAEMTRLAYACGGRSETLAGLAGMGDLVLTCTGELSRNRMVGCELGKGRKLDDIIGSMRMVAEGVKTTDATVALAELHEVEMPITFQVQSILQNRISPSMAIRQLMERSLKFE
jgi:glycerol-3-phosphate dehydrogenase (NAD(P)+)